MGRFSFDPSPGILERPCQGRDGSGTGFLGQPFQGCDGQGVDSPLTLLRDSERPCQGRDAGSLFTLPRDSERPCQGCEEVEDGHEDFTVEIQGDVIVEREVLTVALEEFTLGREDVEDELEELTGEAQQATRPASRRRP